MSLGNLRVRKIIGRFVAGLAVLLISNVVLAQTIYSWTGSASNLWSNQNNWTPIGVPQAGDSVAFPAGPTATSPVNDLPAGRSFVRVAINGGGYTLGGNGILLTTQLSNSGDANTVNLPIDVQTNAVEIRNTALSPLRVIGGLSGNGPLTLSAGNVRFGGGFTYSGTLCPGGACTGMLLDAAMFPSATNASNGNIGGNGTLGALTGLPIITPGSSIEALNWTVQGTAVINTGSLAGAKLKMGLEGSAAGSGYDQINVTGSVNLAAASTLDVSMLASFVPALNQEFVLVNNDGADAITGIFTGKAQGSTFLVNGIEFQISYNGGTGNDIVLTCLDSVKVWTGAVNGLWSNAGNWIGGVPVAGDSLQFRASAANKANNNDLPVGRSFETLNIESAGYALSGNGIVLTRSVRASGSDSTIALPIDVQSNSVAFGTTAFGERIAFSGALTGTSTAVINAASNGNVVISGTHAFAGELRSAGCPTGCANFVLHGAIMPLASLVNRQSLIGNGQLAAVSAPSFSYIYPAANGALYSSPATFGRLQTGNLNTGSATIGLDIGGSVAGTDMDQIDVTGTVTISPTGSRLDVVPVTGFAPTIGQVFVLINNDGSDAITGNFRGKPEGSILTIAGAEYSLSYVGGSNGNDVTLTCLLVPKVWTGAVSALWSQAGNWLGGVPSNGDGLLFPQSAIRKTINNDLAAGLSLRNIAVTGMSYALSGNRIALTRELENTNSVTVDFPIDVGANTVRFENRSGLIIGAGGISGNGQIHLIDQSVRLRGTHTFSGTVIMPGGGDEAGYLFMDGAQLPAATLVSPLSTSGYGSFGPMTVASSLAPGISQFGGNGDNGVGTINSGAFSISNATLHLDLKGIIAGISHDQLNVAGTVTIGASTTLNLRLAASHVPALNQQYIVVNNDGGDAVIGLFNGLVEAAVITVNGYQFQLSYAGGTGNDIVLTSLNGKLASAASLQSTLNPSGIGQSVTFTAALSGSAGVATGNVAFRDGATTLATVALSSGSATYTTSALSVGAHSITAEYGGDGVYGGASAELTQTVVLPSADLQIAKTNQRTTLVSGQSTVYSIVVANAGPNAANAARVSDNLPASLINGVYACNPANSSVPCPMACSGNGNVLCHVDLPVNAYLRIDVMATVQGSLGSTVRNEATVEVPAGLVSLNAANDISVDEDLIVPDGLFLNGFETSAAAALTVPGAEQALLAH